MEMRVISKEKRLFTCCMEVHEVKTVSVDEQMTFKDIDNIGKKIFRTRINFGTEMA